MGEDGRKPTAQRAGMHSREALAASFSDGLQHFGSGTAVIKKTHPLCGALSAPETVRLTLIGGRLHYKCHPGGSTACPPTSDIGWRNTEDRGLLGPSIVALRTY